VGQRLELGKQIESDVYDALCCCEQHEIEAASAERLIRISSLAGELARALNDLCQSLPLEQSAGKGSDLASGARMARNEGQSQSE
jgi:hypothetical protein